jgi:guanyl-specific ribonuclease Sa
MVWLGMTELEGGSALTVLGAGATETGEGAALGVPVAGVGVGVATTGLVTATAGAVAVVEGLAAGSNVMQMRGSGSGGDATAAANKPPADLKPTLDRIQSGGSFPHRNDGSIFANKEGLLPAKPAGYYREYVHPTPGVSGAGPQRVIAGQGGEMYYTPDHYQTFVPIKR